MARDDLSTMNMNAEDVRLGKDLLELLSSAMYVEPLTSYREYLQNAADSIDEARKAGLLGTDEIGRVDITLDQASRTVRIRDNGVGISAATAAAQLLALGGSLKRGTEARGFRGVGRLAALGYAQSIIFRTRAAGEAVISEITWDGRRLRAAFADPAISDLASVVAASVDVRTLPAGDAPEHFFEVEISKIVRQRGDRLLDVDAVEAYLSQVAPVPFADEFSHAATIKSALSAVGHVGELCLTINGGPPITRPHRDVLVFGGATTEIKELQILELPAQDGGLAAIGWFAHHDYKGAIPTSARVKGIRVRVGNIQIGEQAVLEQIFPESRFNSWTIGEVHIFDRRIVPNGRRDEFEANAHYANLVNQLAPVGRDVARRCRTSSALRSKLRDFELTYSDASDRLQVVEQGALSESATAAEIGRTYQCLAKLKRITEADVLAGEQKQELGQRVEQLEEAVAKLSDQASDDPLHLVPPAKRDAYRDVLGLIYECSSNRAAAKSLVERIIERLAA